MHAAARILIAGLALIAAGAASAQSPDPAPTVPWMDTHYTPDSRARLLLKKMTVEEKLTLVRGYLGLPLLGGVAAKDAIGSAGFVPGVPRLGIPALQESDASLGVANPFNVRRGDGATPLPSGLSTASTWNPELAYAGGAMIGHEAWSKGLNVLLAGGANLARDPRNGRNFEYLGEDPLLTGTLAGAAIRGIQDQHVISTTKHFAINDQETGRMVANARLGEAAARESDLLAFELAIEAGHPGSVMCAYNRVNDAYACGNDWLLNQVLKRDWKWPGFVMSDWGAVHGLDDAVHGLDQESAATLDKQPFFGPPLKAAVEAGKFSPDRLDDMARRILRSMFAAGLFDTPATKTPIDYAADARVAQAVAEQGTVLLKNEGAVLPLAKTAKRIVVIGGHADVGVLSGGGSSQVEPIGGAALKIKMPGTGLMASFRTAVYDPSSPLKAIQAAAPGATVTYVDGTDPKAAAAAAGGADVAIVFATQWMIEGYDAQSLSLPDGQDGLIAAVAAANPHTVVVLETGNPVTMPWLAQVSAVLEAWYPGARGGEAIAAILFGDVNPSGRLPISFPAREAQLVHPAIPGAGLDEKTPFDLDYPEGANVGYRGYAARSTTPLFWFGHGLSYTRFEYSDLTVSGIDALRVTVRVKNVGDRTGATVAQIYGAMRPEGGVYDGPPDLYQGEMRLIGFKKVTLKPGESRALTFTADPRTLAGFDVRIHHWVIGGRYLIGAGPSAGDLPLFAATTLSNRVIAP
jgi:beta-glucosidase